MDKKTVLKRLNQIFCDVIGREELVITESTSQEDIPEWDSFIHISILEAVMDEFGINFTLDEMIELPDVGSIAEAIMNKIKEQ